MDYVIDADTREIVGRVALAQYTLFTLPDGMLHRFAPEAQHTDEELDNYYTLPIISVNTTGRWRDYE